MKELLNNNGKPEPTPLQQETDSCRTHLRMSESDAEKQSQENGLHQREMVKDGQRFTLCGIDEEPVPRKKLNRTAIIAILLALVSLVSVPYNIIQAVKLKQLQTAPASPCIRQCPPNWIMNGEMCYFYSDTERSWDFSQSNCSSYGGSLVTIYSQQEWDSVLRFRRPAEYWINLRRENIEEPWKWPNGSLVDSWFHIGGKGLCGYLNERAASSTVCDNIRYWICSKPVSPLSTRELRTHGYTDELTLGGREKLPSSGAWEAKGQREGRPGRNPAGTRSSMKD